MPSVNDHLLSEVAVGSFPDVCRQPLFSVLNNKGYYLQAVIL